MEILTQIFTGTNLALLGVGLVVALPCMGSAKGVSLVGEASSGLLTEDPSKFGKTLILQALPMTQGVYGLVAAFLIIIRMNLFNGFVPLSILQGTYFLLAALPYALVGLFSAMKQGKVAASGVNLIAKRGDQLIKAVTSAALVETYAIFSLLITILVVFMCPFTA